MDMSLVVGLLLLAVMVGSVLLTTVTDARARARKRQGEHNQLITMQLYTLDTVIEGVGRLDVPASYRGVLRVNVSAWCKPLPTSPRRPCQLR